MGKYKDQFRNIADQLVLAGEGADNEIAELARDLSETENVLTEVNGRIGALEAEIERLKKLVVVPPVPAPSVTTAFGSSFGKPLPAPYSKVAWGRTYLDGSETPVSYSANGALNSAVGKSSVGIWLSGKAAPGSWLEKLLASMAGLNLQVIYTHKHELDNDGPSNGAPTDAQVALAQKEWKDVVAICKKFNFVRTACVLMRSKPDQWERCFPTAGIDICGFDAYNGGTPNKSSKVYQAPSGIYKPLADFAATKKLPWGIGETGSMLIGSDQAGLDKWAADAHKAAVDLKAVVACWWNQNQCQLTTSTAKAFLG